MKIGSPLEASSAESRVAWPWKRKQLQMLGHECMIQKGAIKGWLSDEAYSQAGVTVVSSAKTLWEASDAIIKVVGPNKSEVKYLNKSKT